MILFGELFTLGQKINYTSFRFTKKKKLNFTRSFLSLKKNLLRYLVKPRFLRFKRIF